MKDHIYIDMWGPYPNNPPQYKYIPDLTRRANPPQEHCARCWRESITDQEYEQFLEDFPF